MTLDQIKNKFAFHGFRLTRLPVYPSQTIPLLKRLPVSSAFVLAARGRLGRSASYQLRDDATAATTLLVTGFPRSANGTLASYARLITDESIKTISHAHNPGLIAEASYRSITTVVTIRQPPEFVNSYLKFYGLATSRKNQEAVLQAWLAYHSWLMARQLHLTPSLFLQDFCCTAQGEFSGLRHFLLGKGLLDASTKDLPEKSTQLNPAKSRTAQGAPAETKEGDSLTVSQDLISSALQLYEDFSSNAPNSSRRLVG